MKIEAKYFKFLFILAALIIFNQIFIQYILSRKTKDAKTINVAGRQRMLSQKLNLFYYKTRENSTYIDSLKNVQSLWTKSHYALLDGSNQMDLPAVKNKKARKLLNQLTPIINNNKEIIANRNFLNNDLLINRIGINQATFLKKMNTAVLFLEKEAQKKLELLIIVEILLSIVSLTVLYLEFRFLIKPMIIRIVDKNKELQSTNKRLQKAIFTHNHIIREPLTTMVMMINLIKEENDINQKEAYINDIDKLAYKIDNSIKEITSIVTESESTSDYES